MSRHRSKRRRTQTCFYEYLDDRFRHKSLVCKTGLVICIGLILFSLTMLIKYPYDYFQSKEVSTSLQNEYRMADTFQTSSPIPASFNPISPNPIHAITSSPSTNPSVILNASSIKVAYPNNPNRLINTPFDKLRRRNKDIIGWLSISNLLDEAIVQRDHQYYLRRDYLGYHNVNGALFLDKRCDLFTQPSAYVIYGHNMKNGLMFGSLRKYESYQFYRQYPIVSFNTMYEQGQFVIFSASQVSIEQSSNTHVPFYLLQDAGDMLKKRIIDQLINASFYDTLVDVQASDQLLLLVTCINDEESERRIVAARRLRESETETTITSRYLHY